MTLIRDLIDIPTGVRDGDFVLKLTSGVEDDHARATVDSYEVTEQLAEAFNEALGLVAGAVESGESQASYLHGSFGSGKSHFMALLFLLLAGNSTARAKPELHDAIAAHADRLDGKSFLLLPIHFLDARSMEQKILGGYVERISTLHPEAPVPPVFLADAILREELPGIRKRLGEQAFLEGLGSDEDAGDWGEFGTSWTTESVDGALAAPPTSEEHSALAAAYIAAYRPATGNEALATGEGFIDLSRGLAAISRHAQGLGYDGIVLFLDEVILWLASMIGNLDHVQRESQKLTNLVEGSAAGRPIPIVSFVARQRDLRDLVGEHVAGDERTAFADSLALQSGRFGQIVLEASNLPVIAKRRLLQPKDERAGAELTKTVDGVLTGRDDVKAVLLGNDADAELLRTVYPFSPTLVHALVDVAEALQRERTGLKVMLQLLVDHRDDLELGQIIPVGDLWDVVAERDEPFASEMKAVFERAKRLYRTRLRPMLLTEHGLAGAEPSDARWVAFRRDDRLLKTALLAALVPEVEAFRGLDAARLAALNWGSVTSPIPGRETQIVADRLQGWSTDVSELKLTGDPTNPTVTIALVDVDPDEVIQRATDTFDNAGARRRMLRELLDAQLDHRLGADLLTSFRDLWRGTERDLDVVFGNVRDPSEVSDAALRASLGKPKVVIDFPFDEAGRTPEDDLERIDDWTGMNEASATVCWIPSFLNREGLAGLGKLVAIDDLLKGERFEQHTAHLSQRQRNDLRPVLDSTREQLRTRLVDALLIAYGVRSGDHAWVDGASALTHHFRSLDPSIDLRPTTQPSMLGALSQLTDQLYASRYPGHPRFEQKVTPAMLRTTWDEVKRALADPDGRVTVESARRPALRTVANALGLGTMHESHFLVSNDWPMRLDRHLDGAKQEGRTLTVADLRAHIDEADGGPRGLPPEIADLVVLTVAAQTQHSLSHGGLAFAPTPGKAMDGSVVLRPERLPTDDEWQRARAIAQSVLGLAPGAHVTPPEIALLADDVRGRVAPMRDGVTRLHEQLRDAYARWGIASGDRLRTAQCAADLVASLDGADGLTTVEVLASVAAPTSRAALGTAMTSARQVAAALADANWGLLELAKTDVGADVAQVLVADELVEHFSDRYRVLQQRATVFLGQRGPEPAPPLTGPGSGGAVQGSESAAVTVSGESELDDVIAKIRAVLAEHGSVTIRWQAPGDE